MEHSTPTICILILACLCNGIQPHGIEPPKPMPGTRPPFCNPKVNCDSMSKYRKIDGSCNNLMYPQWGMANSSYSRLLPQAYGDGIGSPRVAGDKSPLPSTRKITLTPFATGDAVVDSVKSLAVVEWGIIVTFDMSLVQDATGGPCCTQNGQFQNKVSEFCYPIPIDSTDPLLSSTNQRCMNFTRTFSDKDTGCSLSLNAPAKKLNKVTPWMDLSIVYDVVSAKTDALRTRKDGLMKVVMRGGGAFPPQGSNATERTVAYRMNKNPEFTILQVVLLREHNRLATELKNINPKWNDEKLFQEARRINIAQCQYISYYEWMPTILGYDNLVKNGIIFPNSTDYVSDYDRTLSPDVSTEHAQSAFRYFHLKAVQILGNVDVKENVKLGRNIGLFLNSTLKFNDDFGDILKGLLQEKSELVNLVYRAVMDWLSAARDNSFGLDLRAVDIQRDREHGLRGYNDYRNYSGVGAATSFDDFKEIAKENIDKLKSLYKAHTDVDLSVGAGLEGKVNGADVGPTFFRILTKQFKRTRQADRFWFEHKEAGFTKDQLIELRKSSLSRLFCDNEKSFKKAQRNAFYAAKAADVVPCSSIPVVNLQKWKE